MSECCRELNRVFEKITENAIKRDRTEYGTPEWNEYERQSKRLWNDACNIFFRFYPEYKRGKKHQKSRTLNNDNT